MTWGEIKQAATSIKSAMLLEKRKLAEVSPPTVQSKLRWHVVLRDLCLLWCVALAYFIVWRALSRRDRENSARRRQFKLLRGEGSLAQAQPQVVRTFDWRIKAAANGNRVLSEAGKQGG
jgi:hypothetical protein